MSKIRSQLLVWGSVGYLLVQELSCCGANFTFNIQQPQPGTLVQTQLFVQVAVTSTYQLQAVTASLATQTSNLAYSSQASAWTGTISLSGAPHGTNTLSIVATDVFANSGQAQIDVVKDLAPTLTITEPKPGTVARPQFPLQVTASADGGAAAIINVYAGTNLLVSGTNQINTVASISGYDGQPVGLLFEAVDPLGQTSSVTETVYVFTETNWLEYASVEGPILDVSSNTLLFLDGNALKTKSLISGTEAVLLDDPTIVPANAELTPLGAILESLLDTGYSIYDIRDTNVINLGPGRLHGMQGMEKAVQGNYAIWVQSPRNLFLRDLLAGTNSTVSTEPDSANLAPNGDVLYTTGFYAGFPNNIYRFRNGASTLLVNNGYVYKYKNVSSDGHDVVYLEDYNDVYGPFSTAVFHGSTETVLTPNSNFSGPIINAGWIAFTEYDNSGNVQIWTRSPGGAVAQRTFLGASCAILALAPNGQVIFVSAGRLYLARNSPFPTDLGAWTGNLPGKFYWFGRWYLQIGRTLFMLSGPPEISSAGWDNGQFKLTVTANPGQTVILQASTDFIGWSAIATNTVTNAFCEFLDPSTPQAPGKFYRALTH